ncbi:Uncharacterised protein [Mycobacteroides abscessus]|nr:Uncharacterised protein [Mycobacteroides abscessus]
MFVAGSPATSSRFQRKVSDAASSRSSTISTTCPSRFVLRGFGSVAASAAAGPRAVLLVHAT